MGAGDAGRRNSPQAVSDADASRWRCGPLPSASECPPNGEHLLPGKREAGTSTRLTCLSVPFGHSGIEGQMAVTRAAMWPLSNQMLFIKAELRITFDYFKDTIYLL